VRLVAGFSTMLAAAAMLGARPVHADPAESAPPGGWSPSGTLSLTPEYRWLFGIPVVGGEVTAAFGFGDAVRKRFQAEVALSGFFGRTRAGLPLLRTTLGALADVRAAGFHFGGLLGLGLAQLRRADGDAWMSSATLSTNLYVGPEFVVTPELVLSVDATLAADWIDGGQLIDLWGPGLGIRARLF
jgi:hypothetical protein